MVSGRRRVGRWEAVRGPFNRLVGESFVQKEVSREQDVISPEDWVRLERRWREESTSRGRRVSKKKGGVFVLERIEEDSQIVSSDCPAAGAAAVDARRYFGVKDERLVHLERILILLGHKSLGDCTVITSGPESAVGVITVEESMSFLMGLRRGGGRTLPFFFRTRHSEDSLIRLEILVTESSEEEEGGRFIGAPPPSTKAPPTSRKSAAQTTTFLTLAVPSRNPDWQTQVNPFVGFFCERRRPRPKLVLWWEGSDVRFCVALYPHKGGKRTQETECVAAVPSPSGGCQFFTRLHDAESVINQMAELATPTLVVDWKRDRHY